MGERQESSGSTESSPSPCTPDKDQSGMDGESSATEDLKSPPGSPKAKPDHMLFQQPPLINSETEEHSLFEKRTTILDEGTTDLKLAQLHEMFPGVDIKDFSELLKAFGGDVNSVVDAMLSKLHLATPDAAQGEKVCVPSNYRFMYMQVIILLYTIYIHGKHMQHCMYTAV